MDRGTATAPAARQSAQEPAKVPAAARSAAPSPRSPAAGAAGWARRPASAWFRLGLRPLGLDDRRRFGRRLIALLQFLRQRPTAPRARPPGTPPALTWQRLFRIEPVGHLEGFAAGQRQSQRQATAMTRGRRRRIIVASALLVRIREREQHLDLAAGARWRLRVGQDHVGPALHGLGVLGAPRRKRQRRTRTVAECAAGLV